jgi:hypothetical protein
MGRRRLRPVVAYTCPSCCGRVDSAPCRLLAIGCRNVRRPYTQWRRSPGIPDSKTHLQATGTARGEDGVRHALRWALRAVAYTSVLYLLLLIVARPWHRQWGSTAMEQTKQLPGDERSGNPARAGNRTIAIDAPAKDVWPWLLQLGCDRGGFYSYSALENALGLKILNADKVIPEWQHLAVGDFVHATPTTWLFGMAGNHIGWEVDHLDTEHHILALCYWIFEVESIDSQSSRLHVRTHAGDAPVFIAPFLMLFYEPAHFVMERAMLIGIKTRAERLAASHARISENRTQ